VKVLVCVGDKCNLNAITCYVAARKNIGYNRVERLLLVTLLLLHPFNGPLSGTTRVSRYQKGKTTLDLLEQEIESGSGISRAICKSAARRRQITMPASHHSDFYRPTYSVKALKAINHYFSVVLSSFFIQIS